VNEIGRLWSRNFRYCSPGSYQCILLHIGAQDQCAVKSEHQICGINTICLKECDRCVPPDMPKAVSGLLSFVDVIFPGIIIIQWERCVKEVIPTAALYCPSTTKVSSAGPRTHHIIRVCQTIEPQSGLIQVIPPSSLNSKDT